MVSHPVVSGNEPTAKRQRENVQYERRFVSPRIRAHVCEKKQRTNRPGIEAAPKAVQTFVEFDPNIGAPKTAKTATAMTIETEKNFRIICGTPLRLRVKHSISAAAAIVEAARHQKGSSY